jgi:hypothetical protein
MTRLKELPDDGPLAYAVTVNSDRCKCELPT